jgi:hypothetical protein
MNGFDIGINMKVCHVVSLIDPVPIEKADFVHFYCNVDLF